MRTEDIVVKADKTKHVYRMSKVSYCCLPNIASIIANHNRKKLEARPADDTCNCRVRSDCPLSSKCQARGIVYEATVTSGSDKKTYTGISEPPFKVRYANHKTSFKHGRYRNSTQLSKYVWNLKEKEETFELAKEDRGVSKTIQSGHEEMQPMSRRRSQNHYVKQGRNNK